MESINITGRCSCGAITYAVSAAPQLSVLCFCRNCLRAFGADGYPGMMVKAAHFHVTKGCASRFTRGSESGRSVTRCFCGVCGTSLWGETELGLVSVLAGTLDDPSVFKPNRAVFTAGAPHWARIPADLPAE